VYVLSEADVSRIKHVYTMEITDENLRAYDVCADTESEFSSAEVGPKNLIVSLNRQWLVWKAYGTLRIVGADCTAVPTLLTAGVAPQALVTPNRLASDMMPVLPYALIGAAILAGGIWMGMNDPDRYDLRTPIWKQLANKLRRRRDIL